MLPQQTLPIPEEPKLYYIIHADNLSSISQSGFIYSDALRIERKINNTNIGMPSIKERRLRKEVTCHPNTFVGQYVPFYFCPRSIMLYIISMGNHRDLAYRGGQAPIVHLQIDLRRAVEWADQNNTLWAFTDRNAAAAVAGFYKDYGELNHINWDAVATNDWVQPDRKEYKQAEFLIHNQTPWELVEKIGVINGDFSRRVAEILQDNIHNPEIAVEKNWYY